MGESLYNILVWALDSFVWDGDLLGEDNLPERGPAVFIANHLEAAGTHRSMLFDTAKVVSLDDR